jgi:hypothetical protein
MIDEKGQIVITPNFDEIEGPLEEGVSPVKTNGLWGYIDRGGTFVVKPQFEFAEAFTSGVAAVKRDGRWGFTISTTLARRSSRVSMMGRTSSSTIGRPSRSATSGVISTSLAKS